MISTLNRIRLAGGRVVVLDGKLRIEAPPGVLTDQDQQVLTQHKQDLLQLLAPTASVVDPFLDQERQAIQWVEGLSPAEADLLVGVARQEWAEIVERLDPCSRCGSLELWQDLAGGWHCQRCEADGVRRSDLVAAAARRIRAAADAGRLAPAQFHRVLPKQPSQRVPTPASGEFELVRPACK